MVESWAAKDVTTYYCETSLSVPWNIYSILKARIASKMWKKGDIPDDQSCDLKREEELLCPANQQLCVWTVQKDVTAQNCHCTLKIVLLRSEILTQHAKFKREGEQR